MVDNLVGKWKCVSNENMSEFLEKMGIGFLIRKLASNAKPSNTITFNNGVWTIKSESALKTSVHTFEIDKEFEEEMPDGKKVKSTAKISGRNMIHVQRDNGNILCTISREIDENGQQIVIYEKDGVKAKRVFERD